MWKHKLFIFTIHVMQVLTSIAVHWKMDKFPVKFGGTVELTCMVNKKGQCNNTSTRRWDGGVNKSPLLINGYTSDVSKYYEITNEPCINFSLVIMDFGIKDVNCEYWCSFGFETSRQELILEDGKFIKEPTKKNTEYGLVLTETTLKVDIIFLKVYPKPKCKIMIGDLYWVLNETLAVNPSGTFFDAFLHRKTTIRRGQCHHNVTVSCTLLSYVILQLDESLNCTEKLTEHAHGKRYPFRVLNEDKPSKEATFVFPITAFVCLAIMTTIGFCEYRRNRLPAKRIKYKHDRISEDGKYNIHIKLLKCTTVSSNQYK